MEFQINRNKQELLKFGSGDAPKPSGLSRDMHQQGIMLW